MSSFLASSSASVGPSPAKRARNRRLLRKYDPEEERLVLQEKLEEERAKRRELESEIFRLRQERSDMCMRMSKLETSKIAPNIPQSLVPMLADTMAKGGNPLQGLAGVSTSAPVRLQYTTPPPTKPPPPKLNRVHSTSASHMQRPPAPKTNPVPVPKPGAASQFVILPTTLVSTSASSISTMPVVTTAAASAQSSYIVQHKTNDGKVMSFLIPVNTTTTTAVTSPAVTSKATDAVVDKTGAEGTGTEDNSAADTATDADRTAEDASPESPPPDQVRGHDVVTIED